MTSDETDLGYKLLTTFHLDVAERCELPDARMKFSTLVAVVGEALEETGWFPVELAPGEDIGQGAVAEFRDGVYRVHEQHEIGVSRYSAIRVFTVEDVAAVTRAYISAIGGSPIDGVDIDWSS